MKNQIHFKVVIYRQRSLIDYIRQIKSFKVAIYRQLSLIKVDSCRNKSFKYNQAFSRGG